MLGSVVISASSRKAFAGLATRRTMRRLGPGHDVVAGWRANNWNSVRKAGQFEDALNPLSRPWR